MDGESDSMSRVARCACRSGRPLTQADTKVSEVSVENFMMFVFSV